MRQTAERAGEPSTEDPDDALVTHSTARAVREPRRQTLERRCHSEPGLFPGLFLRVDTADLTLCDPTGT